MLTLSNISKNFGDTPVLHDVNLSVQQGEFVSLLGLSGSGKTTLLRIIAGLEQANTGAVSLNGEIINDVPVNQRQFGVMFQNYALFRHMTVWDNVAYGLKSMPKATRPTTAEINERVQSLLDRMQVADHAQKYPNQLSGGQKQRVALARALAINPKLLLLDEPFSALDAQIRKSLRDFVRDVCQQFGVTTIMITHDQDEAMALSDRIAIMHQGEIIQYDTPKILAKSPQTDFVKSFLAYTP